MKTKQKERPKKLLRQRQRSDCSLTIIRDGRVIVQTSKPIKKPVKK